MHAVHSDYHALPPSSSRPLMAGHPTGQHLPSYIATMLPVTKGQTATVQGDVTGSFFSQNSNPGDGSILFRTECIGKVGTDNKGLDVANSRQVHTDNNSGSSGGGGSSSSSSTYNDYT